MDKTPEDRTVRTAIFVDFDNMFGDSPLWTQRRQNHLLPTPGGLSLGLNTVGT
jgi:hypothetical protein